MNYSANKDFLLGRRAEKKFPLELINEEVLVDKEFIFVEDSKDNTPSSGIHCENILNLSKTPSGLSSCFITQEETIPGYSRRSNRKGSISWRKHSECERKTSLNSNSTMNLSEVKEVDFRIVNTPTWSRKNSHSSYLLILPCEEVALTIASPTPTKQDKLHQMLNLVKVVQKRNKKVDSKVLEKINEKFNLPLETPLWQINCTRGFGWKSDLLFGPFTSPQIADLFENKSINENTEIRMSKEIPNVDQSKDLNSHKGKDYRIKNLAKVFGLEIKQNDKRKMTYPNDYDYYYQDDNYYDYQYDNLGTYNSQYDYDYDKSIYSNNYNFHSNPGSTKKKNAKKINYNYKDEYYYDRVVTKK